MYPRLRAFLVVILATTGAGACDTANTIVITPPTPTTESLSGKLTTNGGVTHRFTTKVAGEITVRLKALAPVATVTIGMALGVWTGASCNLVLKDEKAALNTELVGAANATGEFCARVSDDAGTLTDATDYTIEVTHF